jgi:SPX domain protein involved in polyphosphate accumulation
MVKFGEYLRNNAANDWAPMYLNYAELRRIINDLEVLKFGEQESTGIGTSLSVPRPTNAAGTPIKATISQEDFFVFLENEMRKIEDFTKLKVGIK